MQLKEYIKTQSDKHFSSGYTAEKALIINANKCLE